MNQHILARNILILKQVKSILSEFAKEKISTVLLKGSALVISVYEDISLRPMEDIDILVKKSDLPKVVDCITKNGYHLQTTGEHCFTKSGEIAAVDVHTDIPLIPEKEIWTSVIELDIDGLKVLTLSPENHIIYIIYHSIIHHGTIKDIWLEDIQRLMDKYDINPALPKGSKKGGVNWDGFTEKVKQLGFKIPVYLFLSKANKFAPKFITTESSRRNRIAHSIADLNYKNLAPSCFSEKLYLNFLKFIVGRKEIPDIGHIIKFISCSGFTGKCKFLFDFLFPQKEFLRRRYDRNSILAQIFRPFSIAAKTISVLVKFIF